MRLKGLLFLTVLFLLLSSLSSFSEPIPKKGRVAVVLRKTGSLGKSDIVAANSAVISELAQRGYRVVDMDRLNSMKRSEAARLAFEGDTEALIALGRKYSVSYYIRGIAEGHKPVVNEFGLYTATVNIALQAYRARDGKYLFADSVVGKEVGYTAQEASSRALKSVATKMAVALAEDKKVSPVKKEAPGRSYSLTVYGLRGLLGAENFRQELEASSGVSSASLGSSVGAVSVEVSFRGSLEELSRLLRNTFKAKVAVESSKSLRVDM